MTPKALSSSTILRAVSDESMGFRFGKPERPNESSLACILPILRETSLERQYVTLPETENVLVSDSGTINRINLKNASKKNVFVRSGTIFEGKGTQSRALTRSAVLFPGTEVALDVRCVHQTHGIRTGAEFKYGGITPLEVDSSLYAAGYRPQDQHTMWNAVRHTTASMRTMSGSPEGAVAAQSAPSVPKQAPGIIARVASRPEPEMFVADVVSPPDVVPMAPPPVSPARHDAGVFGSGADNLKQEFDAFARNFDAMLSKARLHDNQVGLALITETGCKTIELFDLSASWEAIHKDAVKRMGTELLRGPDNTQVFEYKPENAVNAVRQVLGLDYKTNLIYEHKPGNGEPPVAIFGITAARYVGEIVEIDGRVVHLTILETAVV
ncbi:MAG: hypothetical protein LAO20_10985 [Acidobacteriia bacterium]|nr:hypothetical protein [Terriglobia bacterium]